MMSLKEIPYQHKCGMPKLCRSQVLSCQTSTNKAKWLKLAFSGTISMVKMLCWFTTSTQKVGRVDIATIVLDKKFKNKRRKPKPKRKAYRSKTLS